MPAVDCGDRCLAGCRCLNLITSVLRHTGDTTGFVRRQRGCHHPRSICRRDLSRSGGAYAGPLGHVGCVRPFTACIAAAHSTASTTEGNSRIMAIRKSSSTISTPAALSGARSVCICCPAAIRGRHGRWQLSAPRGSPLGLPHQVVLGARKKTVAREGILVTSNFP